MHIPIESMFELKAIAKLKAQVIQAYQNPDLTIGLIFQSKDSEGKEMLFELVMQNTASLDDFKLGEPLTKKPIKTPLVNLPEHKTKKHAKSK